MQKEINKFLKKLSAEKLRNNHKECIELYNIIGGLYSEIGSYDEAVHYHEQALELCKIIGDRLGTALALRYIGEAKAALSNFYQAIDHVKKYLELAQKINDKVEIQRAWTTLGRVYLMQAQEMKDKNTGSSSTNNTIRRIAREAKSRFDRALSLAESVRDQVDDKEYAQMKSGLLINLALIEDLCGNYNGAVGKFNKAMETCRSAKLKEDLFRCQIILAGLYRQRNDVTLAVKTSEDALQTAKSIGRKILICDALIERGLVRICQRDFKNAKRTFTQAYLEKSPSEDDHSKAIRLTKLSHLICVAYEKLCNETTAGESKMKLCDKLGDLFVAIGNYKLAIEYYRRAFADAKACSKPKNELARILYSIAETYADDGQYKFALACYEKELTYRAGNIPEECSSLIKIAHMHEYLESDEPDKDCEHHENVCGHYEKALEKAGNDPKLMYNVLKYYVPYMKNKSYNRTRCNELDELLTKVKSYPEVEEEIEAEDYEEANDLEDEIANVDDIITDNEDDDEVLMIGRRRVKGSNRFKQNEVGDTPLHEASIKGDFKRVKSLIAQGHEVNPHDHAGWIPLHEACNHGHYQIAEFLIEHGADVNNRGLKGVSPLHDAATNGHYDIMRLLIKNGANAISLTDTGETVLSCLRDYKTRNLKGMSNSELTEYKQMEAELLNVMDKFGFNLMTESVKGLGNRNTVAAGGVKSTNSALLSQRRPAHSFSSSTATSVSPSVASSKSSVKEYRDAIVTMKRKRPMDVSQPSKRASQPATISTNISTSVSTKHWLLNDDDVIEEENDHDAIVEETKGDDDDVVEIDKNDVINVDDDLDDDDDMLFGDKNSPELPLERERERVEKNDSISLSSMNFSSNSNQTFDVLSQPLVVTIEDRKLMIPIREYTTVGELKELIIDRYSILVNAKAKILLAPKSDTSCHLFDADLCKDVVRESLVAIIDSWQLESIEDTYVSECSKYKLEPLDFVKLEMRGLDELGTKLDLSYMRFPIPHRPAIINSLSRRDFISANFQGSVGLFEKCPQAYLSCAASAPSPRTANMLETITTWSKMTRLNLKCTGLLRSHFEQMSNSKSKMPELLYLDVSFNSIYYKHKQEFSSQIEKLRQVCPKLKRLDMRKNHLKFMRSLINDLQYPNESTAKSTEVDISKELNLSDIEFLGNDQCDYIMYSIS